MLINTYKKYLLKITKVYFSDEILETNSDLDIYKQYVGDDVLSNNYFHTLIIDLNQSVEKIRKNIRNNYIHRINQAVKKHHIKIKFINKPSISKYDNFIKIYNKDAIKKGYANINRNDYLKLRNNILISYAIYDSRIICGHLYIYDEIRIRQSNSFILNSLNSESIRNISSKANKYLHYSDILYAKEHNFKVFDLGGVFNLDPITKGVTIFKLGFSNKVEKSCGFIFGKTLKGKLIIFLLRYFKMDTLKRFLFIIYLYLNELILSNKFYFSKDNKISKVYYYGNYSYLEYSNFSDFNKIFKYKPGENILIYGLNHGMAFLFYKNFKKVFIRIVEKDKSKFKTFTPLYKKIRSTNIQFINSEIQDLHDVSEFKYLIINDINITLDGFKLLLSNIKKKMNDLNKFYIIYINPIYNHLFDEYKLFLIKDIKSVLSSRVHVYSNQRQ